MGLIKYSGDSKMWRDVTSGYGMTVNSESQVNTFLYSNIVTSHAILMIFTGFLPTYAEFKILTFSNAVGFLSNIPPKKIKRSSINKIM